MLRVPDRRVGVYNRVGLLSRGWGSLVNTCKQCQKQWLSSVLTAGLIRGEFRAGFFIFGKK